MPKLKQSSSSTRRLPAETEYDNADEEYHTKYRLAGDLRDPYRVPNEFLANTQEVPIIHVPEAPTIAFINSKSGGRAGPQLSVALRHALGYTQVFDLSTCKPDQVLEQLQRNFVDKIKEGDPMAGVIRGRLRIIAAGGDGTVAWILQTIKRLNIEPAPAVAILPLGTGNDLARSFDWGGLFEKRWIKNHNSIYNTLKRIADAEVRDMDCWQVKMTAPDDSFFKNAKPYGFVPDEESRVPGSPSTSLVALSWNYVSVGFDAQAAYGFHHLRETKPQLAFNRMANQFWYGYFGCKSGWFCPSCTKELQAKVRLSVRDSDDQEWRNVPIESSVKAVVMLNLQSYGGGRDIWGKHHHKDTEWKPPSFSDGLVEVVGLQSGWHTGLVMAGLTHGKRLAQARAVRLELRGAPDKPSGVSKVHVQLDGEPWRQPIPCGEAGTPTFQIELTHANQSKVLFNTAGLKDRKTKDKLTKPATDKPVEPGAAAFEEAIEMQPAGKAAAEEAKYQAAQAGSRPASTAGSPSNSSPKPHVASPVKAPTPHTVSPSRSPVRSPTAATAPAPASVAAPAPTAVKGAATAPIAGAGNAPKPSDSVYDTPIMPTAGLPGALASGELEHSALSAPIPGGAAAPGGAHMLE